MAWCARPSRPLAGSVLGLYLLVASGLPLGLPGGDPTGADAGAALVEKDRAIPFPCMNKPCGCRSAEQCFTSCCCHTPAETRAWARARGLEPLLLAWLARRAEPRVASACAAGGCCAAAAPAAPVAERAGGCCAAAAPADRAAPAACAAAADEPAPPTAPVAGVGRVLVLKEMLACGGIVSQWSAAGSALPVVPVPAPAMPAPAGRVALGDVRGIVIPLLPDPPPPRAA